jgi:hypothetical protein
MEVPPFIKQFGASILEVRFVIYLCFRVIIDMATQLTHSLILQLNFLHQSMDRLLISPKKVQWIVMSIPVAVLLLVDLSLLLPPCPQARALTMGQLMTQLNIVIALIVRMWHF